MGVIVHKNNGCEIFIGVLVKRPNFYHIGIFFHRPIRAHGDALLHPDRQGRGFNEFKVDVAAVHLLRKHAYSDNKNVAKN